MRAIPIALLFLSIASWASEPVATSFWSDKAIGGHDTLGYYAGDTLEGSKQHKVRWQAADWYFASAESAARFAASPEDYVPHYNGHCANALSLGEGL